MDAGKINYVIPEDILYIIWKIYYSEYVLPIIKNKKESQLYLYDINQLYLNDINQIRVYATNYNILRIMSGMSGLRYSN